MPTQRTPRGGTRGTVYLEVAKVRMEDAKVLKEKGRYNGSIYLAGYAIECRLKYAYCRRKQKTYLPGDLEVHDWDALINAAGLLVDIAQQTSVYAIYSALAEEWGPTLRYRTAKYDPREASRLYNEMIQLYLFLSDCEPWARPTVKEARQDFPEGKFILS